MTSDSESSAVPGYAEARELSAGAPRPAVVGNVLFGTAGWTDKSLLTPGLFYPRGTKTSRDRLAYYFSQFSLVEVDSTYYALLPRSTAEGWIAVAPGGARFDVKAHPVFTGHPIDKTRLPADLREALTDWDAPARPGAPPPLPADVESEIIRRFLDFLEPLVSSQRLGCLMLQFPPWFTATRGNARRLEELRAALALPLSVEFRHKSWLEPSRRERVFGLLTELRMTYVAVDEPNTVIGGLPGVTALTTPELAIVRLHGRNASGWRRGSSVAERFRYLYSEPELREWSPRVRELAARAKQVHVVFNNCVRDFAVLNAKGLAAVLAE